jgi:hypothetical protein
MPSYTTITEADAYFNDRLNIRPWELASSDERRRGLAQATSIIDRLNFLGAKTSDAQENQFPRNDDTLIPNDVKNATSEIALALLDGVDPELEFENIYLRSQGYSSIRATYEKEPPPSQIVAGIPSITAWRYLLPYLRDPHEVNIFRTS